MIDMQNDFIDGALGSAEASAIVPHVVKKLSEFQGLLLATFDVHDASYLQTQEGRLLPVPHCVAGTHGVLLQADVFRAVRTAQGRYAEFYKSQFASVALAEYLCEINEEEPIEEIELIGVCTDICVVSNALLLKATLPEAAIAVDASCCAGTTPEAHRAALLTMRSCQVIVRNW